MARTRSQRGECDDNTESPSLGYLYNGHGGGKRFKVPCRREHKTLTNYLELCGYAASYGGYVMISRCRRIPDRLLRFCKNRLSRLWIALGWVKSFGRVVESTNLKWNMLLQDFSPATYFKLDSNGTTDTYLVVS